MPTVSTINAGKPLRIPDKQMSANTTETDENEGSLIYYINTFFTNLCSIKCLKK